MGSTIRYWDWWKSTKKALIAATIVVIPLVLQQLTGRPEAWIPAVVAVLTWLLDWLKHRKPVVE